MRLERHIHWFPNSRETERFVGHARVMHDVTWVHVSDLLVLDRIRKSCSIADTLRQTPTGLGASLKCCAISARCGSQAIRARLAAILSCVPFAVLHVHVIDLQI
jgi:hypothetical protein